MSDEISALEKLEREQLKLDIIARSAVLLSHAIVYTNESGEVARKHLWSLWQGVVETADVSLYDACLALYQASGPSLVYDYVNELYPDRPWRTCSGCEAETPRDDDSTCLVCGEV